jgi:class 3 adenylate cyclase
MTEATAARTAAYSGGSTTGRVRHVVHGQVLVDTERVDHLLFELLSATDDIIRRHRLTHAEYEELRVRLVQASTDGEWPAAVDVLIARVVEGVTKTDRHSSGGSTGPASVTSIARCGTDRVLATVLFTDIVDSTRRAAELGDRDWLRLLDRHDDIIRAQIAYFRGRVVSHTGDGAVAIFDGPSRAVQSAAALTGSMSELGIGIRCGVHTGECELRGDDIGGIAVHTGARIAALAHAGEVLVSNTVKDLVNGSGIGFQERGTHVLKGLPGAWRLFAYS